MKRISYKKHPLDGTWRTPFFLAGKKLVGAVLFQTNQYNIIDEKERILASGEARTRAQAQKKVRLALQNEGVVLEESLRNIVKIDTDGGEQ